MPQDYETALKWYTLAAEQGNLTAQHGLGTMYADWRGPKQDYTLAYMWLDIALSRGSKAGSLDLDLVARKMSPTDISIAQRLARECVAKNYRGC